MEAAWRAKKQFETWRFQSVQIGCTIWPNWNDHVWNHILNEKKQDDKELVESHSMICIDSVDNKLLDVV